MYLRKDDSEAKKRLIGIKELTAYIGMGTQSARNIGKIANAEIHIGRRVLYDIGLIDAYIDKLHE